MIFTCPECQARNRGACPGSVVACRRCASPVVVPEIEPETTPVATPAPAPKVAEAPDPRAVSRRLWRTATLVLLAVGLAHGALYLLLTMEARAGMSEIEALYSRQELSAAHRPSEAPVPGTPAYASWRREHDLWLKSEAYGKHRSHAALLRTGLLASFLVQVAMTGWILMRLLGRSRAARKRESDA